MTTDLPGAADPRGPQMNWLTPFVVVRDPKAGQAFYAAAFGFQVGTLMDGPDGTPAYADMAHGGRTLFMMGAEGAWGHPARAPASSGTPSPVGLYVYVDDVDAQTETARAAGAEVVDPPEDMPWGDRVARLRDPDGHVWSLATHRGAAAA